MMRKLTLWAPTVDYVSSCVDRAKARFVLSAGSLASKRAGQSLRSSQLVDWETISTSELLLDLGTRSMTDQPSLPMHQPDGAALAEIAERRLRQSPYFYLKSLRCRFEGGVLTISGCVPYRQLRQLAERIVAQVDGVRRIANNVEVIDPVELSYRRSSGA